MLVLRLELWPYGDRYKAREIGSIAICNDTTGDSLRGNYKGIECTEKGTFLTADVQNFDRERGAWDLVHEFMKAVRSKRRKNIDHPTRAGLQTKLTDPAPSKPQIDRVYAAALGSKKDE